MNQENLRLYGQEFKSTKNSKTKPSNNAEKLNHSANKSYYQKFYYLAESLISGCSDFFSSQN